MDILAKLKGVMTEEDLGKFEVAVKEMIDEKVKILVESEVKKLEDKAEEFCTKEVSERLELAKTALIKEYDGKFEKFENNLVEKLDLFLESEINSNISDEMINKIAVNETYRPIVEEIAKIFEEKYVALDTEGYGILKEAKEEIVKLEGEISNTISEKMEVVSENEKLKSAVLFLESVEGLKKTQKEKVLSLIEGKEYKEIKKTIGSIIDLVVEQDEERGSKKTITESASIDETTIEETVKPKKVVDSVEKAAVRLM
jgi:hypothetical protein